VVRRDTTHRYEKGGVYTYRRKTAGCMKDTGRRGNERGKAGIFAPKVQNTEVTGSKIGNMREVVKLGQMAHIMMVNTKMD